MPLIPFTPEWRRARDRMRDRAPRAARFVASLQHEPDDADVDWLASAATNGDLDHARWELRYARLALGVLAAQRDPLDDQTAADVVEALANAIRVDERSDPTLRPLVERQLNDRLAGYREALAARGGAAGTPEKLGRVLLAFASDGARSAGAPLGRAAALMVQYDASASETLRRVYGAAVLPEDVAPSRAPRTPRP